MGAAAERPLFVSLPGAEQYTSLTVELSLMKKWKGWLRTAKSPALTA